MRSNTHLHVAKALAPRAERARRRKSLRRNKLSTHQKIDLTRPPACERIGCVGMVLPAPTGIESHGSLPPAERGTLPTRQHRTRGPAKRRAPTVHRSLTTAYARLGRNVYRLPIVRPRLGLGQSHPGAHLST